MASKFECEKCGKKFDSKLEAVKHEKHCGEGLDEWVCETCGKTFDTKKECEKHESHCIKDITKKKFLSSTEYSILDRATKKEYVCEWACKCNNCGKSWAYLDEVENKMNSQIRNNACNSAMICNPCVSMAAGNANTQLDKQIKELKQCPNCKSSNVKREARYFKKE